MSILLLTILLIAQTLAVGKPKDAPAGSLESEADKNAFKTHYEIAYFFTNGMEIKKTRIEKLKEMLSGFADLPYADIELLTDRLIPLIAINTEISYNSKQDGSSLDYNDHKRLEANVKDIAKFHTDLLSQFPDQIIYYTMKFADEEEKLQVYNIVKAKFEQNRRFYMESLADHWEKFRNLAAVKLPKTNTEIMRYFSLLEAYIMLSDRLETINKDDGDDDAKISISQTLIATSMFEAVSRLQRAFKQYKVSFISPFLASYMLQQSLKMIFGVHDDFLMFIDQIRFYSLLVQKEAVTVYYNLSDLDYTIMRNRKALIRIFTTAHKELNMPDVYLEVVNGNVNAGVWVLKLTVTVIGFILMFLRLD